MPETRITNVLEYRVIVNSCMNGTRVAGIIVGVLLVLSGGTFALQGEGMLGTGSFMDSNPAWIYIGSFLLVIGIILAVLSSGFLLRPKNTIHS